jgi:hypothetical protein
VPAVQYGTRDTGCVAIVELNPGKRATAVEYALGKKTASTSAR